MEKVETTVSEFEIPKSSKAYLQIPIIKKLALLALAH